MEAASSGLGGALAGAAGTPGDGRRNIASIVGRRLWPNGVDRKSVGRSIKLGSIFTGKPGKGWSVTRDVGRYGASGKKPDAIICK